MYVRQVLKKEVMKLTEEKKKKSIPYLSDAQPFGWMKLCCASQLGVLLFFFTPAIQLVWQKLYPLSAELIFLYKTVDMLERSVWKQFALVMTYKKWIDKFSAHFFLSNLWELIL